LHITEPSLEIEQSETHITSRPYIVFSEIKHSYMYKKNVEHFGVSFA